MDPIWLQHYPKSVPHEIQPEAYDSISDLFNQSCKKYASRTAYSNMGCSISFAQLEEKAQAFAAYLQNSLHVKKGERIAIMLPNVLQYPVAMFGAFYAGLTVVNVNPLYTPRELIHQLTDAGVTTIVVLSNFASVLQQALRSTPVKHVIVTEVGDLFSKPKSYLVNFVVKYIKPGFPIWYIPGAISFNEVLRVGAGQTFNAVKLNGDDIAYLQATGGTTGVPKSAILLHRNMLANMEQVALWVKNEFGDNEIMATPLPLYHVFSLCANSLMMLKLGTHSLLITNPRDIPNLVKEIKKNRVTWMTGVNTLFNALLNNEEFRKLDFSTFHNTVAGGMALQKVVAEKWYEVTGHYICEGYGLTETSPVVAANPIPTTSYNGGIGFPLPSTLVEILDDDDRAMAIGEIGELCVKGPQVMQGYWNAPEETAKVFTKDGWLRTGDIAKMDAEGQLYIVDRKKDLISVSGFKVFPNEVEDVIAGMPGVLEVAVIGVPDQHSVETVKAFIVKRDPNLTEQDVKDFCHKNLTAYKVPKYVEFRTELPKTNVGKILHRALREEEEKK